MASPFAAIGMAATAGGGILSALGAQQQAGSQAGMYQYQAGVADLNSRIAKQNADYAVATGQTQVMIQGLKSKAQIGQDIARQGASGIAVGSGSSADVLESEHKIAGLEAGIITNNAARQAYGYEVEAAKDTSQGLMYRAAADDALKAGQLKSISSIIGATSSVASKWSAGQSSGLWNV